MFDDLKKQVAAIYVRVSTDEQVQEGQSIQAQIEVLTQYCKLFGIKIFKIYKDLGLSGKNTNRPGLEELIKDSKAKSFNTVVVWKISRLSRSLKDLLVLLDQFEHDGINFISYSEKFDTTTPVGRMTLQILGSIAEFERNTIVENVKLGLGEVARQGRKASCPMLGYDYVDKDLQINPSEAETIRLIFDMYINRDIGISGIAKWLNVNGYKTKRGNNFGKDTVGDLLANPIYIGKNRHNIGTDKEYVVDGIHEPIIDIGTWEAAQAKRDRFKDVNERRHACGESLLAGFLSCPDCGSNMVVAYHRKKRPNKDGQVIMYRYRYYECNNFQRTKQCNHNRINAINIEKEVIERLKNLGKNPELLKRTIKEAEDRAKLELKPMSTELYTLSKQIAKLKASKEKYLSLFESGKLNNVDDIIDRINKMDAEIDILISKETGLRFNIEQYTQNIDVQKVSFILNNFALIIDNATDREKKLLLQKFLKEVVINKERKIESVSFIIDESGAAINV